MLKKMLLHVHVADQRSWDKMLPLVLLVYREVPQDSTGFSPFESVYTWDKKGLLHMMKEQWVPSQETKEDVATHVATLHWRMFDAQKIVCEHLKQAQQK